MAKSIPSGFGCSTHRFNYNKSVSTKSPDVSVDGRLKSARISSVTITKLDNNETTKFVNVSKKELLLNSSRSLN